MDISSYIVIQPCPFPPHMTIGWAGKPGWDDPYGRLYLSTVGEGTSRRSISGIRSPFRDFSRRNPLFLRNCFLGSEGFPTYAPSVTKPVRIIPLVYLPFPSCSSSGMEQHQRRWALRTPPCKTSYILLFSEGIGIPGRVEKGAENSAPGRIPATIRRPLEYRALEGCLHIHPHNISPPVPAGPIRPYGRF